MKLYIAEKPSLGREIAKMLGAGAKKGGYIECENGDLVTWCFGHMFELADPDDYSESLKRWSMETLPIIPESFDRKARSDARDQIATIKKLMGEVESIVNCGDPDREGQLLVDELLEELGNNKQVERAWLTALDEKSLRKALGNLKPNSDYTGLRNAAYGRSLADWLVGINLTRAYTVLAKEKGHSDVFSVGRVQSPTLKLVVERDLLIENFKKTVTTRPHRLCSQSQHRLTQSE